MKYSFKLLQGMKNNLWKNESKIILYERCENALKAQEKLCKLGTFWPISNFRIFCQNKNSLELLNIIFENSSPKGSFRASFLDNIRLVSVCRFEF